MTLEDIGERDDALLCLSNLADCHSDAMGLVLGNWFFLNGTRVPSNGASFDFYSDRIEMVVRLNRRLGGEEGIYHCEIPDLANVTQTIYIGVFTASSGEWHCLYTPVLFNISDIAVVVLQKRPREV